MEPVRAIPMPRMNQSDGATPDGPGLSEVCDETEMNTALTSNPYLIPFQIRNPRWDSQLKLRHKAIL